jgi:prepilin-type N-terminal cleavage/methylation domain-containing protein
MLKQMCKRKKGFTLIEMLIVITIIALLASLILVGMGGARQKARDARRIADLHNVQNALELYFSQNGRYPASSDWNTLVTTLTGAGIGVSQVPKDPLNNTTYYYRYGADTNGTDYVLGAQLEQCDIALKSDIDGTVYSIDCSDNNATCTNTDTSKVYCIKP